MKLTSQALLQFPYTSLYSFKSEIHFRISEHLIGWYQQSVGRIIGKSGVRSSLENIKFHEDSSTTL